MDTDTQLEVKCPKCNSDMKEYTCTFKCRNTACYHKYNKQFTVLDDAKTVIIKYRKLEAENLRLQDEIKFLRQKVSDASWSVGHQMGA